MSPSPQLAPPGSSTYNSPTMYVGDGTWDSQRNTFLLPNLQGLNYNTMRYNGMGNRFREIPQYYTLILAHGILAAITFLFIVPAAILVVRFYKYRNPYMHVRIHVWLQIMTVLLTTVIFILGFFAVGPERSLTNPHHGIGVAIFVLVLIQFIGGWWVNAREKRKRLIYEPVKLVLHKWLGRTIALIGLVQVPLGLTLYGAPLYLFVLYTLAVFTLLVIYFILDFRRKKHRGRDESNYSYASGSGSIVNERRGHGRLGKLAEGAAVGGGLGALANRFRNRTSRRDDPEVIGSRRHSGSYVEEEKYSQYSHDSGKGGGRFRDKLLGVGAIAAASYYVTRLLGRKDRDDDDHDSGATVTTEDSIERVERAEEGRPLPSGRRPLNQGQTQPLNHRRSTSLASEESYESGSPSKQRRGHGLRDAVLGLGAVGLARNVFQKRRERKEQRRIDALREQEIEDERIARQNSQRYTGDGVRPPRRGAVQSSVGASTDFSEEIGRHRTYSPPPLPGGTIPVMAGALGGGTLLNDRERQHMTPRASNTAIPGPLPPPPPGAVVMPPIPPDHQGILHHDSSGSEMYTSASGRNHRRHRPYDAAAAAAAGGAAGLLAGEAIGNRRDRNSNRASASAGEESVGSQGPVSVKVKMHSDGRHVTLRRLPEEEAAAERAARRSSGDRNGRRRRNDSASTLSGPDLGVGGERWRRTEALERQQAMEMERERANLQAEQQQLNQGRLAVPQPGPYPPPPPMPMSSSPLGPVGSVGSPGTYDGTATEASADYAINRKRRRAERAQAKMEREGRGAQGVESM
ncbi:hypothetical protein MMC26_007101 [Xylographa opegraphella]|nr:hypothetical protein [Xylographa opegraphella]